MKKVLQILVIMIIVVLVFACNKDDAPKAPEPDPIGQPDPDPNPENRPPGSFSLLTVQDNATDVDVVPSLSWEQATDPDGDSVTYDLYLDTEVEPLTLITQNLGTTSFTIKERLETNTQYYWKVVAKDTKDSTRVSTNAMFSTRDFIVPEMPSPLSGKLSKRSNHSSAVFKDRLWVLGGRGAKDSYAYTEDGIVWVEEKFNPSSGFSTAEFHRPVVFNDKLWVIGGDIKGSIAKNPVWSSDDGVNWMEESVGNTTNDFFNKNRFQHTVTVFDNKIWVIGGLYYRPIAGLTSHLDAWFSTDGKTWEKAAGQSEVFGRSYHTAAVFDNRLWLISGLDFSLKPTEEVWHTKDGTNWSQTTVNTSAISRIEHASVVFDNRLWAIEGVTGVEFSKAGIWYSKDGAHWNELITDFELNDIIGHTATVFKNKLFVIGGSKNGFNKNDVWVFE